MATLISSNASAMPAWNFFNIDKAEGDVDANGVPVETSVYKFDDSICIRTAAVLYIGDITYKVQTLNYPRNTDWRVCIEFENRRDCTNHFKTLGQCLTFVEERCNALEKTKNEYYSDTQLAEKKKAVEHYLKLLTNRLREDSKFATEFAFTSRDEIQNWLIDFIFKNSISPEVRVDLFSKSDLKVLLDLFIDKINLKAQIELLKGKIVTQQAEIESETKDLQQLAIEFDNCEIPCKEK